MSNPFTAERERRSQPNPFTAERENRESSGTWQEAYANSGYNRFVNSLLAFPSATGDLLAGAAAGVEGAGAKIAGGDFDFGRRYAEQQEKFPASAIRSIPRPTIQDVEAAGRSIPSLMPGGESPGEAFGRHREELAQDEAQMRSDHPVASTAGDITGDIATLISGRAPVANLVRKAEQRIAPKVADMSFGAPKVLEPGIARTMDRAINSAPVRRLARGASRSVETGLEAAVMEVLKGDDPDPLEAAAFAAGGQMAGSALLEGTRGLLSGGPLKAGAKISLTAVSIAGMWQLGKSATPGGRDRILESIETGYDKVAYGLMLGTVAAMTGAPRYRSGKLAEEIPIVVDALASVPRGVALSVITDLAKADEKNQKKIESALDGLARDPDYTSEDATERRIIGLIRSIEQQE